MTGLFLNKIELLSLKTITLLGSTKKMLVKDAENVPKLESVLEVVLVHCNLVNNNCQQAFKVLFTSMLSKKFGELINIALHSVTILNATNTELSFTKIWFTDQNSKALEREDNVNMTLLLGQIL